ncbi:uncharacterized protein C8Q71DRAFT_721423 [Rhodofomes roseus]|uniref:Uncharacterized protein n=1 Tax=Rhodofomes roseus TaxID=34475 RepID=A0ABQ8KQT8_9APHY|nr:uncharacterized protein C8Q71DRAFT_721423 [Rhodofomes roseus]KAH9840997.1 hypothetical protein C8Q71DRAFT_721423 [Rhodofomes roseus]
MHQDAPDPQGFGVACGERLNTCALRLNGNLFFSSVSSSVPVFDISNTSIYYKFLTPSFFGSALVGLLFSAMFYGLTSDKALMKAFVSFDLNENTGDGKTVWALVIEGHANPPSRLIEPRVYAVLYPWTLDTAHAIWINVQSKIGDHGAPDLPVPGGFWTQEWIIQKVILVDEVASAANYCAAALADLWIFNRGILLTAMQFANLGVVRVLSFNSPPVTSIQAHLPVYINTMMAVLNARQHLSAGGVSYISSFTDDAAVYVDGISAKGATIIENIPLTTFSLRT